MRFARPAEAIERLKALHERNPQRVEQLLENALAWPTVAAGLTKEEVKEIRCQAGLILFTFNTEFSSLDGKGSITLLILKESISLGFIAGHSTGYPRMRSWP